MTITLKDVGSGFNRTAVNENFSDIENELNNNVLRRDGVGGGANQMEVHLDMNSNRIINLADGVELSDAATVGQLVAAGVGGGGSSLTIEQVQGMIDDTIADTDIGDVFIGQCSYSFDNVYDMMNHTTFGGSVDLQEGMFVSAGLTTFEIVSTATNLPINDSLPNLYAVVRGDLWADDFVNSATLDDSLGLRTMRDHAESLGRRVTLRSSGRSYRIQTTETVPEYGGQVGLYLTNLSKVRVDFGGSLVYFDTSLPALGAITKDALLALAPPSGAGDNYAFASIRNIDLSGGAGWTTKAERPINLIRGNYRTLAYCIFEDIKGSYASGDCWITDGYVMLMRKVRMRYAGESHAGFRLETTVAAKTGYLIDGCTVDYAGNYGFEVTGSNGHTYCHINNCHVDFVGKDDGGSIIEANVNTAYAYSIRDVRVFNMTACGIEYCLRGLSLHNTRTFTLDGLYALGCGHTSTELPHLASVSGYFEHVALRNFENRNAAAGGFTHRLDVENANAYNTNKIEVDTSIPLSTINYVGGTQSSSNLPLVMSPEQLYKGNYRRGSGDAVKTGLPQIGASATAPYSASDVLEQTWYITTSAAGWSQDLIGVVQRTGGNVTFFFEFKVCRATATAPSEYVGAITVTEASHQIVAPVATAIGGSGASPTIVFVDDRVGVTLPNSYAGYYIKVTAVQRGGTNYTRFNWL